MPGAEELKKGDLKKKSDKSLAQTVETSYIYQRGQGDDIEKTSKNRRLINAVVADDAALLFAKGVSARQSILVEDGSLYQVEFKKNNIDEILNAAKYRSYRDATAFEPDFGASRIYGERGSNG